MVLSQEEEQRLLALKKEQERLLELAEQERVRQAELEKSKKAVVSAAPAKTLNTTITLPSTDTVDNYQITPVSCCWGGVSIYKMVLIFFLHCV